MDSALLETAVRSAGVLPSAVEDAVRRLEGHFSAMADPSPTLVSERILALREQAPHLFPPQPSVSAAGVPAGVPASVWQSLSPASKIAYARAHGYGLPPVERRAKPLTLSSERAAALAKLPAQQRLDAYRQLQAAQQQEQQTLKHRVEALEEVVETLSPRPERPA
jgi:hypothetical protein